MFNKQTIKKILKIRLGVLFQHDGRNLLDYKEGFAPTTINNVECQPIIIVTPSFNQGDYIKYTVESVISQNYKSLNYIIQDSVSEDKTSFYLNKIKIKNKNINVNIEKDTGQANAINRGFSHIKNNSIMAWLNSDDILLPGSLAYINNFFIENPDVDVVYGNRLIIDKNGSVIGDWLIPYHSDKVLKIVDYVPQETLFWRHRAWEKVGGYINENLDFAIDWDLLLRFQESGCNIRHVPYYLGGFRVHSKQKTIANADIGALEGIKLRQKNTGILARLISYIEYSYFLFRHIKLNK